MTADGLSTAELDDLFSGVANEVRIDILRALWAAAPRPLSFSSLRSRVGLRDSGTFNYHLDVLCPAFVRRREGEYTLTHAGRQVMGAVVSGGLTDAADLTVGPVPAGDCIHCGGDLVARYDDGLVTVDCADCDGLIIEMPLPPVAVPEDDPEALPRVFSRHVLTRTQTLARGFCARCRGRVGATLTGPTDDESMTYRSELDVRFECRECGVRASLNVGAAVMDHPAVVSFLHEAGIDLRETYVWDVLPLLDPEATVTSEDPFRLTLAVRRDGDVLELDLDETGSVVAHRRPGPQRACQGT